MEVSFGMPDDFFKLSEKERIDRGKITNDFCQLDKRYFIRSIFPIPVLDRSINYCWGVWVELSKEDFTTAYDTWDDVDVSRIPRLKGILANVLSEYIDLTAVKGELELRSDSRPLLLVSEKSKFFSDQNNGITIDDTIRYYHYIA
jgi:hypothetical protein